MSKVVQFLEALGASADRMTNADYLEAVEAAGLDSDARAALISRDAKELNRLLGGRATVLAYVFTPDREPDGDSPMREAPDDNEKESPGNEPENSMAA